MTKRAYRAAATAPATVDDAKQITTIRGIAYVYGVRDRMGRVIEQGAFGTAVRTVPLLAYHDDEQPIGTATLTPTPQGLEYVATFVQGVARVEEIKALIRDGAIPFVSIGWLDEAGTSFWSADWETLTFPDVTVVELSVVPIPAMPLVTLQAAKLQAPAKTRERDIAAMLDMVDEVGIFTAEGRRNSSTDLAKIQKIHDMTAALGATCGGDIDPDADEDHDADDSQENASAALMAQLRVSQQRARALEV